MWLAAFVAFAAAVAFASSARARKKGDTRAAAVVFWLSLVSVVAIVLIAVVAHLGTDLVGGCET
jgi:hypothetical protein